MRLREGSDEPGSLETGGAGRALRALYDPGGWGVLRAYCGTGATRCDVVLGGEIGADGLGSLSGG